MSYIINAIIALFVGLLGTFLYNSIRSKVRDRNVNVAFRVAEREHAERLFANYLMKNPAMIAVIRSNYRAKLARLLFDSVLLLVLFSGAGAVILIVPNYAVNPQPGFLPPLFVALLSLAWGAVLGINTRIAYAMRLSNRRVAAMLDAEFPVSTDLSDDVWRRFAPREY